jgi:hypothetical protein
MCVRSHGHPRHVHEAGQQLPAVRSAARHQETLWCRWTAARPVTCA